ETVLKIDIVTDAGGSPSVMINQRGEGYEAGDIVAVNLGTMTDDDNFFSNILEKAVQKLSGNDSEQVDANTFVVNGDRALVALFDVADLLTTGGDLEVTATDTHYSFTRGTGFFANQAELEIGDSVTLKGRNVNLSATADNTDPTEDGVVDAARVNEVINDEKENKALIDGVDFTKVNSITEGGASAFDAFAKYVGSYLPFTGIGVLDVDATISVGNGTAITAVNDVDIRTNATSAVEKYTKSLIISFMVGVQSTDVNSTIELGEGGGNKKELSITGGGDVRVLSVADNDTALELEASGGVGPLEKLPSIGVGVVAAVSTSLVDIAEEVKITSTDGDVVGFANSTKSISIENVAEHDFAHVVADVSVAVTGAEADFNLAGDIVAENGDVQIASTVNITGNTTEAKAKLGNTVLDRLDNQFGIGKFKSEATKGALIDVKNISKGKIDKVPVPYEDTDTAKSVDQVGLSFAVNFGHHKHEAKTSLGSTASIQAGGAIQVTSQTADQPMIVADAKVQSYNGETQDYALFGKEKYSLKRRLGGMKTAFLDDKGEEKKIGGALALTIGDFNNHSFTQIDENVVLESAGGIDILTTTELPYGNEFQNLKGFEDVFNAGLNAIEFTNYGFTSSYANASAEAEKFGLGASVNLLNFQTTANTDVASGVRINQDADNKTPGDVSIAANSAIEGVHLTGNFEVPTLIGSDAKTGIGGTVGVVNYNTVTQSTVNSDVKIKGHDVVVDAETSLLNVALGVSLNKGSDNAVSGVFGVVNDLSKTTANIADGVDIEAAGDVQVDARDEFVNRHILGSVAVGSGAGVGATIGVTVANRDTRALVGPVITTIGADSGQGSRSLHE
ncbi:MAG: hypothetical protein GY880_24150, partial [Planctomycetaceae bacterium]|nr:hypothetical protein [Planctomycetaceae bacterium]